MGPGKAYRFAQHIAKGQESCIVVVNNNSDKKMFKAMFKTLKYDKAKIVTRDMVFDVKDYEDSK